MSEKLSVYKVHFEANGRKGQAVVIATAEGHATKMVRHLGKREFGARPTSIRVIERSDIEPCAFIFGGSDA